MERTSVSGVTVQHSGLSIYSQDPARVYAAFVTQVSQARQIPFSCVEDITGLEGANITYICRRSGATITTQGSPHPDQITMEIKGTFSHVQTAPFHRDGAVHTNSSILSTCRSVVNLHAITGWANFWNGI
ncbi:unnamed protein product [Eruca vesicaria subsp. sativa]|uniref:K Homology domain-containing protein n=1 Tax=Eruca vesicaria subsp. sativa TaxID=29727 RepID=A0ABC8L9M8_ERUVS|nr:unnamed protein product [Eruca vesicaria subsp. sativa]